MWENMSSDGMKSSLCLVHAHTSVIPDKYTYFSAHQPFHPRELSSWLGRGECKLQASGRRDEKEGRERKGFRGEKSMGGGQASRQKVRN